MGGNRIRGTVLGLCLLVGTAEAGGLTVAPVRMSLAPGQLSSSISVTNAGDQPQTVQVESFRWTRSGGEDLYERDGHLLVNPPLFELAPGASQLVRVGLRPGGSSPAAVQSFRIFLQEVPRELPLAVTQLQMVLRIGIPVFVASRPASASLTWQLELARPGEIAIVAENRGEAHARVSELRLSGADGAGMQAPGFAYVFPGETYRWTLPLAGRAQAAWTLSAHTDEGPVRAELALPTLSAR